MRDKRPTHIQHTLERMILAIAYPSPVTIDQPTIIFQEYGIGKLAF